MESEIVADQIWDGKASERGYGQKPDDDWNGGRPNTLAWRDSSRQTTKCRGGKVSSEKCTYLSPPFCTSSGRKSFSHTTLGAGPSLTSLPTGAATWIRMLHGRVSNCCRVFMSAITWWWTRQRGTFERHKRPMAADHSFCRYRVYHDNDIAFLS